MVMMIRWWLSCKYHKNLHCVFKELRTVSAVVRISWELSWVKTQLPCVPWVRNYVDRARDCHCHLFMTMMIVDPNWYFSRIFLQVFWFRPGGATWVWFWSCFNSVLQLKDPGRGRWSNSIHHQTHQAHQYIHLHHNDPDHNQQYSSWYPSISSTHSPMIHINTHHASQHIHQWSWSSLGLLLWHASVQPRNRNIMEMDKAAARWTSRALVEHFLLNK